MWHSGSDHQQPVLGPDDQVTLRGQSCIAFAVFTEARGSSWLEQAAVVNVIRARIRESHIADPCTVVLTMPELGDTRSWPTDRLPWEVNGPAWLMALQVTEAVLTDDYLVGPWRCAQAVTFTRAGEPAPQQHDEACRIGGRVFYAPAGTPPAPLSYFEALQP